jgi:hypothetical protein
MTKTEDGADAGSLLSRTVELLKGAQQSYFDIYDATGFHPNWLSGIANGRIRDPSVNRIQALYEFLTGDALKL